MLLTIHTLCLGAEVADASLFAYFGTAVTVSIPWHEALRGLVVPTWRNSSDFISLVVAVLGTTISPYLFSGNPPGGRRPARTAAAGEALEAPEQAPAAYERIRLDTWIGMALSNLVALAIMLTAAATCMPARRTRQCANGGRSIAADRRSVRVPGFCFGHHRHGLDGGAGAGRIAAYAIGEALRWPVGLARRQKRRGPFMRRWRWRRSMARSSTFCRSIRSGRLLERGDQRHHGRALIV